MASSFKILHSSVAGHVPTLKQMQDNHIAINEADGLLFWLDADNATIHSAELTVTPQGTLSRLLQVDGSGSGIDADKLDGYEASSFSLVGHSHAGYAVSSTTISGGGLASGGGDLSTNRTITVTKASTAQAQAGTDDATVMTPAKTSDAITALAPAVADSRINALVVGKQAIWIPAVAMTPRTTNGPATGKIELATNKVMLETLDFDTTTQEFAQFWFQMPKSWNKGSVTFQPVWSHPSTSSNFGVVWQLSGVAIPDASALDTAQGTAQTSTDTGGTTNYNYIGPESSAITIAGTLNDNAMICFQVARAPANGSDTLAVDARLHGIHLFITTSAVTDA